MPRFPLRRFAARGALGSTHPQQDLGLPMARGSNPRRWPTLLATLCISALAACTTLGPDYQRAATSVQSGWSMPELANTASGRVTDDEFWASFSDPTLLELLRHAQKKSLTLQSAALQVDAASETVRINAASLLPSVSATGSRNYNQPDNASKQKNITFSNIWKSNNFNFK